jgi:hypothetical protein
MENKIKMELNSFLEIHLLMLGLLKSILKFLKKMGLIYDFLNENKIAESFEGFEDLSGDFLNKMFILKEAIFFMEELKLINAFKKEITEEKQRVLDKSLKIWK